jgi:hypothetical protein
MHDVWSNYEMGGMYLEKNVYKDMYDNVASTCRNMRRDLLTPSTVTDNVISNNIVHVRCNTWWYHLKDHVGFSHDVFLDVLQVYIPDIMQNMLVYTF